MADRPAERRIERPEPARRLGATPTKAGASPLPANDNAPPLVARIATAAGFAILLCALAALAFLLS